MGTDLAPPRVVLITDWALPDLLARVDAALGAGRLAVQHRHPGASDRVFFEQGVALAKVCARHGAPLFVNRRLDVALALEGVLGGGGGGSVHLHLPSHGLRVGDVKAHLGARWLSVAVHDEAEAEQARGATFALVSPVFRPGSKPDDARAPLGPEGFRRLAALLACPAYALGGMNAERAVGLGAAGVAVIGAILSAPDPRRAAGELLLAAGARQLESAP